MAHQGLHVERGGAGADLIVLLYGLGATGVVWHGLTALIERRGARWMAPDLRGHGRSEMPATGYTVADNVDDLGALARRFSSGSFSAADLTRILGAGLRGGGNAIADDEVAAMACDGGIAGCAAAVADLLNATFGGGEGQPPQNP